MPLTDLEVRMSTVAVAEEASTAVGSSSAPNCPSTIRTGDLVVDLNTRVVAVNEKPVHLTGKEYGILELLSLRKGTTSTKEMFLNHLYGGMDEPELKIIDVFVCKLRKKLAQATGGNHYIETIWGRGYVLRDPALTPAATLLAGAEDHDARNDETGSRAA
jgi:two-component system, cell cycle response regulator CtrA